jgi:hypothetical protein
MHSVLLVLVQPELNYVDKLCKKPLISIFRQIRPVGGDLFHADRRTDRHDEGNNRLMQLLGEHA